MKIEKPIRYIKVEKPQDVPAHLKGIPFAQLKGLALPIYQTNFKGGK